MKLVLGILIGALALLVSLSGAFASCDPGTRTEILGRYNELFHEKWGEQSPREDVDRIATAMVQESLSILERGGSPSCRFSHVVGRSLPVSTPGGLRLAPTASAIAVIFEFTATDHEVCVGLNNRHKVGLPPDERFPHMRIPIPEGPFGMTYLHYAMTCADHGLIHAGYKYY